MNRDSEEIRILGIDPGSQVTGWGLIVQQGSELRCKDYGVIRPPRGAGLPQRLLVLHEGIASLLADHRPGEVAVEDLYVARNVHSALVLGHARGVILLACAREGVSVHEYPANTVKEAVLGQGGAAATKERIGFMVRAILEMDESPGPSDVTDALACAICHAHKRNLPG